MCFDLAMVCFYHSSAFLRYRYQSGINHTFSINVIGPQKTLSPPATKKAKCKNTCTVIFMYAYHYYPVHIRTAGLCIWSRRFVYVCMCICDQKTACLRSYTTWKSSIGVTIQLIRWIGNSLVCAVNAHYLNNWQWCVVQNVWCKIA